VDGNWTWKDGTLVDFQVPPSGGGNPDAECAILDEDESGNVIPMSWGCLKLPALSANCFLILVSP